jgi:hypothetical protein
VLKDDLECSLGASGTIHINLKSREYNGKYYTNVTAWKSEMVDSGNQEVEPPF